MANVLGRLLPVMKKIIRIGSDMYITETFKELLF